MNAIDRSRLGEAEGAFAEIEVIETPALDCQELRPRFGLKKAPQRRNSVIILSVILAGLMVYAGVLIFPEAYDNDVWFFLATGEYIVEHGIPYTNPFSVFPEMGFVAQQWVHCVISFLLYRSFGFVGLSLWTVLLLFAFAFSLFALARRIRGNAYGAEVIAVLVFACIVASSSYVSVRPHLYSMLAFTWILWFLEGYRRTQEKKYLVAVPLIIVAHVNLHAAIAPFDLFIIACYALPDLLAPFHKRGRLLGLGIVEGAYPRVPVLVTLVVGALALLVNPYGIEGALYVFLSIGSASYKDNISEMGRFVPAAAYPMVVCTTFMFLAVFAMGKTKGRELNVPFLLLCLVGIVGAMAFIRNVWLGALFSFVFIVWAARRLSAPLFARCKARKPIAAGIMAVGFAVMCGFMVWQAPTLEELPADTTRTPVRAMDYLDSLGANKETTKVFTFFNAGGYIEYRGYKVNMDPRPEIWDSKINKQGYDYYKEYTDMASGDMTFNVFNMKYGFDVFVIDEQAGTDSYFVDNNKYEKVLTGNGYNLYVKRSWLKEYKE